MADRVVSQEISGGIFPEVPVKIALFFRNNSAEKFRTFLAYNFIKYHKKCQVSEKVITTSTLYSGVRAVINKCDSIL